MSTFFYFAILVVLPNFFPILCPTRLQYRHPMPILTRQCEHRFAIFFESPAILPFFYAVGSKDWLNYFRFSITAAHRIKARGYPDWVVKSIDTVVFKLISDFF